MRCERTTVGGFVGALLAAAAVAAPAFAQSSDAVPPAEAPPAGPPPATVGAPDPAEASRKADEVGALLRAAEQGNREAGAPAPAGPAPTSAAGPAGPAESPDRTGEINSNYDATLDIYQNILDKQGTDTANLDRRIQANEEVVAKYKPLLAKSEAELRQGQVDFMSRALALKAQREQGQLTEETFGRLITQEETRQNRRREGLVQDVVFYRDEIAQAEARLKDLKEQRKLMAERAAREGKVAPAKKAPGEALLQGLAGTLQKLEAFKMRYATDASPRCRQCSDFAAPAPAVPAKQAN